MPCSGSPGISTPLPALVGLGQPDARVRIVRRIVLLDDVFGYALFVEFIERDAEGRRIRQHLVEELDRKIIGKSAVAEQVLPPFVPLRLAAERKILGI